MNAILPLVFKFMHATTLLRSSTGLHDIQNTDDQLPLTSKHLTSHPQNYQHCSRVPHLSVRGIYTARLLSVLEPRWWNELPLDVRTAESLAVFK